MFYKKSYYFLFIFFLTSQVLLAQEPKMQESAEQEMLMIAPKTFRSDLTGIKKIKFTGAAKLQLALEPGEKNTLEGSTASNALSRIKMEKKGNVLHVLLDNIPYSKVLFQIQSSLIDVIEADGSFDIKGKMQRNRDLELILAGAIKQNWILVFRTF